MFPSSNRVGFNQGLVEIAADLDWMAAARVQNHLLPGRKGDQQADDTSLRDSFHLSRQAQYPSSQEHSIPTPLLKVQAFADMDWEGIDGRWPSLEHREPPVEGMFAAARQCSPFVEVREEKGWVGTSDTCHEVHECLQLTLPAVVAVAPTQNPYFVDSAEESDPC